MIAPSTPEQHLAFLRGDRYCCNSCVLVAANALGEEIARLRGTLAARERQLWQLRGDVRAAVDRSNKSAPKERDNISRNTLAEDLEFALLKERPAP